MNQSDALSEAYNAYCVDLIRTAGLLLRTTPSVIYRASTLLQRFEHSVNTDFRSRYCPPGKAATGSLSGLVEYGAPVHVVNEMASGLVPLADLFAPVEYCVSNIIQHEDVCYLAAACLLIAVKMEDPSVRIRAIVNIFVKLSQRRVGNPMTDLLKPPPERYDDFKLCVAAAEEVILHQLGFQIFVEVPYKYVAFFLRVLVEETDSEEDAAAYHAWLSKAVSWLNDVPRFQNLVSLPAALQAVFAIHYARPPLVELPSGWSNAFGVSEEDIARVQKLYDNDQQQHLSLSSVKRLEVLRGSLSHCKYRTRDQLERERAKEASILAASDMEASKHASPLPGSLTPPPPAQPQHSSPAPEPSAATSQQPKQQSASPADSSSSEDSLDRPSQQRVRVGAEALPPQSTAVAPPSTQDLLSVLGIQAASPEMASSMPLPPPPPPPPAEEEDGCVDIGELRRRRRQEEKERERALKASEKEGRAHRSDDREERRDKKRRSRSRRHSKERRRRREDSREKDANGGRHAGYERIKRYEPRHSDKRDTRHSSKRR